MRVFFWVSLVMLVLVAAVGCGDAGSTGPHAPRSSGAAEPLTVYVVNYPLQYFAERIGGENVEVVFPAPQDVDPADWSPDAEIVAAYQKADLILLNGAGYAGWVARASLPEAAKVDTSVAFRDRLIPLESAVTHAHGPQGTHEHGGFATTTWLDPTLAVEQARAVAEAFERERPQHTESFRQAFDELTTVLRDLDQRLAAVGEELDSERLLFSHPVYQYLIRRYDLDGRSLHWEPDVAPNLDELARALKDRPARLMIWEAEPLPATEEALDDAGIAGVVFAPCGRAPETGDLISEMQRNLSRLETLVQ